MTFAKRMLESLDDVDAELDALGDEGNLEASQREFEDLFWVEERLRSARKRLHRILARKEVGPVLAGMVTSEGHPVFKMLVARARRRRDKAAKLRRSFLRVV